MPAPSLDTQMIKAILEHRLVRGESLARCAQAHIEDFDARASRGLERARWMALALSDLVIPHIFDHMDIPRTMSSSRRIPFQITSFPGGLSFFLAR